MTWGELSTPWHARQTRLISTVSTNCFSLELQRTKGERAGDQGWTTEPSRLQSKCGRMSKAFPHISLNLSLSLSPLQKSADLQLRHLSLSLAEAQRASKKADILFIYPSVSWNIRRSALFFRPASLQVLRSGFPHLFHSLSLSRSLTKPLRLICRKGSK